MHIEEQSPDIGQGVHGLGTKTLEEIGAGDQGHMFGYATDETPELMPLTHVLATQIGHRLTEVRITHILLPHLLPAGHWLLMLGALAVFAFRTRSAATQDSTRQRPL